MPTVVYVSKSTAIDKATGKEATIETRYMSDGTVAWVKVA